MNVKNLDMCAYSHAHEEVDQVYSWNNLLRKLPRAGIMTPGFSGGSHKIHEMPNS